MSASLVILLHGVGSRGDDLEVLARAWAGLLPDTAFAAPDAPFPFDHGGGGRQWFSVTGVTEADRPARVEAARAEFDRTIATILAERGFADRLEKVALVGFSQGSIMALDALASGRWRVAAVVAFAGRLASPEPLTPKPGTPVLLVHGTADPGMPVALSEEAQARLAVAGIPAGLKRIPGCGHHLEAVGVEAAGRFLAEALNGD